ncbi:head-tail connector protein [Prosthecomicrobium hirschii]|uniref:head-tail connector protein n=1 Tax=Prosthecodimorpha hirschii TaxID=665126 RepID=UPI00222095A0|nr:hypothetical protein [Prosthecomicrobium hirschii]MCW1844128.1 hypothetical protein [Prosthecomicrobium hirschii]
MDIAVVTPVTGSAWETVVSVSDLRLHRMLLNSDADEDARMEAAIRDAMDVLDGPQGELRRSVLPVTYDLYLPAFPASRMIEIPLPPLQSVGSLKYLDTAGATQTLSSAKYVVRSGDALAPGSVELLGTEDWPAIADHPRAVTIRFTAGYATVPQGLKRATKLLAAHYMENIEATANDPRISSVNRKITFGLEHLFDRYRVLHRYA